MIVRLHLLYFLAARTLIVKCCSQVEGSNNVIERPHRHLWISTRRQNQIQNNSQCSNGALIRLMRNHFGPDFDAPYCKPVKNQLAYRAYCNKASRGSISDFDQTVIGCIASNPRLGNSDILAKLIPELGVDKAQSYYSKMNLLRDYVKQTTVKRLESKDSNMDFIETLYQPICQADITIPGQPDMSQPVKVAFVMHHYRCMQLHPRFYSDNGDDQFGLFLTGPPSAGKPTLTTTMISHMLPPDKGVGKWNTSAPVLLFDDWNVTKLFTEYQEYVRRVALGHDLTKSVHASSRNLGSKWIIVTSNDDLQEAPLAIQRRFIVVRMEKIAVPRPLTPNLQTFNSDLLTYAKLFDWSPLKKSSSYNYAYKSYSKLWKSSNELQPSTSLHHQEEPYQDIQHAESQQTDTSGATHSLQTLPDDTQRHQEDGFQHHPGKPDSAGPLSDPELGTIYFVN